LPFAAQPDAMVSESRRIRRLKVPLQAMASESILKLQK